MRKILMWNTLRGVVVFGLLIVGGAVAPGCADPCADLSCTCAAQADCPEGYGCGFGTCYPHGRIPMGAPCAGDDQCETGVCDEDIDICTSACDAGQGCRPGWTCYSTGLCIQEHSLPRGAICGRDIQCAEEDHCVAGVCQRVCTIGYGRTECPDGEHCAVNPTPVCQAPYPPCDPGDPATCASPRVCVDLGGGLGICRFPCTYSLDTGTYSDDCRGVGFYDGTCTPMGSTEIAACMEAGSGGAGSACNNGTQRCAKGAICRDGTCRTLCVTGGPACAQGSCQVVTSDFSACLP